MLWLFRSTVFLLALPFLTVTAGLDVSPAAEAGLPSLHRTFTIAEVKLGALPVRINFSVAKRIAAELEDGPEGEDEQVANLVRGYDGDDQIETRLYFTTIAFRIVTFVPNLGRAAPARSHSACAGFPTGPPAA